MDRFLPALILLVCVVCMPAVAAPELDEDTVPADTVSQTSPVHAVDASRDSLDDVSIGASDTLDSTSSGIAAPVSSDTIAGTTVDEPRPEGRSSSLVQRIWSRMTAGDFVRSVRKYSLRAGILLVSIAVIIAAVLFFIQKTERRRFMTTTRLAIMDKEVQRTCRYIEKHYEDPSLSIDRICGDLVTGAAFLEALFKEELGMSVEDFIAQVRINRAKLFLNKEPDLPVEELVGRTGFDDHDNFHATFAKITGVSTDEYRHAIRSGAPRESRI